MPNAVANCWIWSLQELPLLSQPRFWKRLAPAHRNPPRKCLYPSSVRGLPVLGLLPCVCWWRAPILPWFCFRPSTRGRHRGAIWLSTRSRLSPAIPIGRYRDWRKPFWHAVEACPILTVSRLSRHSVRSANNRATLPRAWRSTKNIALSVTAMVARVDLWGQT